MDLRPGGIYWASDGAGGRRAFVVVSRQELNRGHSVLAVPFTSARYNERKDLPNCVPFEKGDFGLTKRCVAQADALTNLSVIAFDQPPQQLGELDAEAHRDIIKAIGHTIVAVCEPEPLA